jgi:hypothetical protein
MAESIRTACQGCRQVTQYRDQSGTIRPMVLAGSGTIWVDRAPGGMVEVPCPLCGESEDAGWLTGFLPPV